MDGRFARAAVLLGGAAVALVPWAARLRRSWPWRVAVEGHSMEPALRAGDWLLVDPLAYRGRTAQLGELIVVRDPRGPTRWLVKRVSAVERNGAVRLASDHPAHADDTLPPAEAALIVGRPWLRYRPLGRFGRLA